jgi:hypothetical protein
MEPSGDIVAILRVIEYALEAIKIKNKTSTSLLMNNKLRDANFIIFSE